MLIRHFAESLPSYYCFVSCWLTSFIINFPCIHLNHISSVTLYLYYYYCWCWSNVYFNVLLCQSHNGAVAVHTMEVWTKQRETLFIVIELQKCGLCGVVCRALCHSSLTSARWCVEGSCPPGWDEHATQCYQLQTTQAEYTTWFLAKQFCRDEGAEIFIIKRCFFRRHL